MRMCYFLSGGIFGATLFYSGVALYQHWNGGNIIIIVWFLFVGCILAGQGWDFSQKK